MSIGYGSFIRRHRLASGFKKQILLSEKSGISATTISRIEKEQQKPTVETLKIIAPFLTSTSYVELMVVCGYWEKDELLEDIIDTEQFVRSKLKRAEEIVKEANESYGGDYSGNRNNTETIKTPSTEEEFIKSINIDDEVDNYTLNIDGQPLTEDESKEIIAYIRNLRQVKDQNKD